MNNKTLIIVIVVLMAIGGILLIGGQLTGKKPSSTPEGDKPPTQQTQSNQNGKVIVGKPITEPIKTINITSSGFEPESLTIKNGVKVIWINKSGAKVNIVPTNKFAPLTLGEFPDGSSVQLLFDKSGTYTYQNQLKPSQTGTITVQ